MRARVPDWLVHRIWWRGKEFGISGDVSIAKELEAAKSDALGMRRRDCTRCIVEGKWPVWKVDFCRRRVPPMLFGSRRFVSHDNNNWVGEGHTIRVELQDLQVHVCVCDDDVKLFFERKEVGGHAFEVVFATAEKHHLIWLFLLWVLVLWHHFS
jgi:hypothetical protein